MAFIWNPNWPTVKNDWTPTDGVTQEDFNDIANTVINAQEGMDALVAEVIRYITDEVTLQNLKNIYGVATGTDTYNVTIAGITAYDTGAMFNVVIPNINTSTCTLNINSLGAIPIRKEDNTELDAGDLIGLCQVVYNGTNFRLTSSTSLAALKTTVGDLTFIVSPLWLSDAEIAAKVEYLDYFLNTTFVSTIAPMQRVMEAIAKSPAAMADIVVIDAYMTTFSNDTNACTELGKYSPAVKAIMMDASVFTIMKAKSAWYNSINTNAASMTTVEGQLFNIYEDQAFLDYLAADTNGSLTFLRTYCPNFMTQLAISDPAFNTFYTSSTAMTQAAASTTYVNQIVLETTKMDIYLTSTSSKKVGAILNAKSAVTGISTIDTFPLILANSTGCTNLVANTTLMTLICGYSSTMAYIVNNMIYLTHYYAALNTIFSSPTYLNIIGAFSSALLTGKANLTAIFADTGTANLVTSNATIAKGLLSCKACSDIVIASSYGVGRCVDSANGLANATFQGLATLANLFADTDFRTATLTHIGISQALCKNNTVLKSMLNTYPESTYNALYACDVTIDTNGANLEDDDNGLKMLYGKNITVNGIVVAATATKALVVIAESALTVSSTGSIDSRGRIFTPATLGTTPWTNRADLNKKSITIGTAKLLVCPYAFTGSTIHKSIPSGGGNGGNGGAGTRSTSGGTAANGFAFCGGSGAGGGGGGSSASSGTGGNGANGTYGTAGGNGIGTNTSGGGGAPGGNGGSGQGSTGYYGIGSMIGGGGGARNATYGGSSPSGYAAGAGSSIGGGGGGGSGGHLIMLSADTITIEASGTINASGIAGGIGGNAVTQYGGGGGGGGGGGYVYLTYKTTYTNNGTVTVAGGAAGIAATGGAATGTNGVAGSVGTILSELIS